MLRDKLLLLGQKWVETNPWYLAPFSWIYGCAAALRNWGYDRGLFSSLRVPCTVVSVGNIVAGGTGKTPFVLLLASSFPNRKISILSRGFGSIPDEAILLARRLPHVRVYVGKDRSALAKEASSHSDLLILDDAFQHRRLHRDFDLVLTRQTQPHYLPWGFLRDQPKRLRQADEVFSAETDLCLKVKRILDLRGREISSIQGEEVVIFSGIANPASFRKTVSSLGARIVGEQRFADHASIRLDQLPRGKVLVCTEKDAVKLPPSDLPIYFLEMEMQFIGEARRWEKLIEKIDQKIDNGPTYGQSRKNYFA